VRKGRRHRGRAVVASWGGVTRGGRLGFRLEMEAERVESMVGDESIERQECEGGRVKARKAGGQTRDGGRITAQRVFHVPLFFSISYFLGVEIHQNN
jgi:hypothetical protein